MYWIDTGKSCNSLGRSYIWDMTGPYNCNSGACPGFLKGGGPISLGSLKKGQQILKGGSNGGGGSSTLVSPRTTNLAYLDAKE